MTEQDLMNYEGTKYCLKCAHERLIEAISRLRSCGSVNFSKVGKSQYNGERLTELINQRDEAQLYFDEIGCEFQRANEAYQRIIPLLDTQERAFVYNRYIKGASNKEIALLFRTSLEDIYESA